jgi:hypothetical protein
MPFIAWFFGIVTGCLIKIIIDATKESNNDKED